MEGLLFFSDYDRRFEDARRYYEKYYKAANLLGAKLVVFHGAYKGQTIAVAEYARRMDILDGDANRFGVTLAQENVARNLSYSPKFLEELRFARPNQRFVFDLKQAVRSDADPFAVLQAMGQGVAHLHLSDYTADCDCLAPGFGQREFAPLFRCLSQNGYSGDAVIELYRQNFTSQQQLDQSLAFLNSLR
ncbi:MAG: sugar phosphate isomerase/epimerase [Oscillospiraceae bacterium]|nr:sugar phosphate isomerase/epimerase [Oscillospiraceae bacterium]